VRPAGDAAKGFISITTHPSGTNYPVLQAIDQYVIKPGDGNLKDPARFGTVYYNLGVSSTGFSTSKRCASRRAKFGNKPLTGEQVRWGFEHLESRQCASEATGRFWPRATAQTVVLRP
jgi:branched-chain amino acid transport system substrate-binding protein